jgi:hypothetical protein
MQRKSREGLQMAFPGKAVELYDWVPESVKIRQQAAIGAVRRFVDTVDGAMPLDAASEIADRLVSRSATFWEASCALTGRHWARPAVSARTRG